MRIESTPPHPPRNANLVLCPDCAKDVFKQAEKCPHRGRTLNQGQSAVDIMAAIVIGLAIAGAMYAGGCFRMLAGG